ncbi:MAG: PLP-dependent aminotransferase family protein, partial [Propionibacteriales bacterium]|nr:PLP-dependent aminotransferase family protein [Propionibacteriales bacterium]
IRGLIQSGIVARASRLPSSRSLARDLGMARTVVEQGYEQLQAEGWVSAQGGSGTFVADVASLDARRRRTRAPSLSHPHPERSAIRLDTGTPWADVAHSKGWRRAWREVGTSRGPSGYPDPAGDVQLREAVAAHVGRHRGLSCRRDDVMITSGSTHALALVLEALRAGAIAVEDPGYRAAVAVCSHVGRPVIDIPVDDEGLVVDALEVADSSRLRAVYVTPAHQHPLGMTMSPQRRHSLLAEASRRDLLIIEDDYDSEFRYDVAPLPALGQWGLDRVAYLGTASKLISPGLRIGWLVADSALIEEISARRLARHDHPNWPVQRALLSMFVEGHVDKVVRTARRVYAERCRLVADRLGGFGVLSGGVAGMYLTLELPGTAAEQVVADAADRGFEIPSLADYCRTARRSGLVIGFGGVTDAEFAQALAVVAGSLTRATRRDPAEAGTTPADRR